MATAAASAGARNTPSAAGPIAGGVIGGIVVVALATYLVWRYCVRKRRQDYDQNEWPEERSGAEKGMDQFSMRRDNRSSTHTMGSIASTVYTRASNIIQIAYIPGVTNRSHEGTPDLVPPVPPIPAASMNTSAASTPHIPGDDQHFFLPMRDSTYSDFSSRNSMARSSVATTIYRNNAIVSPVPAQTVTRAKAVPVSVKSIGKGGASANISRESTPPPMPALGHLKAGQTTLHSQSSIVGRRGFGKAVTVVRKNSLAQIKSIPSHVHELDASDTSKSLKSPVDRKTANSSPMHNNDASTFDDASSDDESSPTSGESLIPRHKRLSNPTREFQNDSPVSGMDSGTVPFTVPSPVSTLGTRSHFTPLTLSGDDHSDDPSKSPSLSQMIAEATRKAAMEPRHGGLGNYQDEDADSGPFSDIHVVEAP